MSNRPVLVNVLFHPFESMGFTSLEVVTRSLVSFAGDLLFRKAKFLQAWNIFYTLRDQFVINGWEWHVVFLGRWEHWSHGHSSVLLPELAVDVWQVLIWVIW